MGPCRTCGAYVCVCPTVTTTAKIPDTNEMPGVLPPVPLPIKTQPCPPHDLSVVVEWEHGYYDNNYGQRGKWNQRSRATATTMRATRLRCSRCPVTEEI